MKSLNALRVSINQTAIRDRYKLLRQWQKLRKQPDETGLKQLQDGIESSLQWVATRRGNIPTISRPEILPIAQRWDELRDTIAAHQVVVIAGETGSGKSTQIPKICLELGLAERGLIGCTQPRRIAARSVANRVAEELQTSLGEQVSFKVRFQEQGGDHSLIRFMTDGILLAEVETDRYLNGYQCLIIDEAHERSLNIDFLLGYLKTLLPRRPDLKLIITSATINTARFSAHFDNAPIIEVSGRTYPVETLYRPLLGDDDDRDRDLSGAIVKAVEEIQSWRKDGDTLIFLPGEREIREAAEALRRFNPQGLDVLSLFARQSASDQDRIFKPGPKRRVVLATNVAETSLTVPRIRYVIDSGLARISRYSVRSKVQRLPVEAISQASANQRQGRCGRVEAGVCIRLYAEDDFANRDEFTDPEIRRSSLAGVILKMQAQRLGNVASFPFIDPPEPRSINDGYKLLQELGALNQGRELTSVGRKLARLPVDPRIGRMVLAAEQQGCLSEVLIIAAGLSVQDPRIHPADARDKARQRHQVFTDKQSDFITWVRMWDWYQQQADAMSGNALRRLCKQHYLAWLRLREWRETHRQLVRVAKQTGLKLKPHKPITRTPEEEEVQIDYASIHKALLTGLLGNIACKEQGSEAEKGAVENKTSGGKRRRSVEYQGARNRKLAIFPASALSKQAPQWMVAADLIETSRLFAHCVAKIEPEWVEPIAGPEGANLLKRSVVEPHWQRRMARVGAYESLTLYGLTVVSRRRINYAGVDPVGAREIFIREGLVNGEYRTKAPFWQHNAALMGELQQIEAQSRRRDVIVDEQHIYDFYDQRLPATIHSGASFEHWRKQAERDNPEALFFDRSELLRDEEPELSEQDYPRELAVNGVNYPLSYHFEPGAVDDGVTLTVPAAALNGLPREPLQWLVPALLEEKLVALIKSLPKVLRKACVPAPDYAAALMSRLTFGEGDLLSVAAEELRRMTGADISKHSWRLETLPAHLTMRVQVLRSKVGQKNGGKLAAGRDLETLRSGQAQRAQASFEAAPRHALERDSVKTWDFGDLPAKVEQTVHGDTIAAFPGLQERDGTLLLSLFASRELADVAHRSGIARLYEIENPKRIKALRQRVKESPALCLQLAKHHDCEQLQTQFVRKVVDQALALNANNLLMTETHYQQRQQQAHAQLMNIANTLLDALKAAAKAYQAAVKAKAKLNGLAHLAVLKDVDEQLQYLISAGFIAATPWHWLLQLPRYLLAIEQRLQRLQQNPGKDIQPARAVAEFWDVFWQQHRDSEFAVMDDESAILELRWMLEEFRVSQFAQGLGTSKPVSAKRLKALVVQATAVDSR